MSKKRLRNYKESLGGSKRCSMTRALLMKNRTKVDADAEKPPRSL
jgi:hypothetical protein